MPCFPGRRCFLPMLAATADPDCITRSRSFSTGYSLMLFVRSKLVAEIEQCPRPHDTAVSNQDFLLMSVCAHLRTKEYFFKTMNSYRFSVSVHTYADFSALPYSMHKPPLWLLRRELRIVEVGDAKEMIYEVAEKKNVQFF